jgi:CYTH domain-containing protein
LVVAEIELEREDQPFQRPDWIGEEVTGDARYYNAALCVVPFSKWGVAEI